MPLLLPEELQFTKLALPPVDPVQGLLQEPLQLGFAQAGFPEVSQGSLVVVAQLVVVCLQLGQVGSQVPVLVCFT